MNGGMKLNNVLLTLVLLITLTNTETSRCGRYQSRIVRNVINGKIFPGFALMQVEMERTCPFYPQRDIFGDNEDHKIMEAANRWKCNYCGKAFMGEGFLDNHFNRRHSETILKGEDVVCLAEFCDVFRCDILSGKRQADYWDMALCLEDDMSALRQTCQKLMEKCVPQGLSVNSTDHIRAHLNDAVCSYLTCNKFWDVPDEESPGGILAAYIILWVVLVFAMIVYYCIFYSYFYTDTFSEGIVYDDSPAVKRRIKPYESHLRRRGRWD